MSSVQHIRQQREKILAELAQLEQVRRGTVTEQMVETGSRTGHQQQRGPYPLYTFKEAGRTISRRLHSPELVALYRKQIEQGRRFKVLTAKLLRLGEELSNLAAECCTEKKNFELQIGEKLAAEPRLAKVNACSEPDLEAWEQAVWEAALQAGAELLEHLLATLDSSRLSSPIRCGCGTHMRNVGRRTKHLTTLLGTVAYRRSLFICPKCGSSCFPTDRQLDVEQTGFSPAVRRRMARAGSSSSFAEAAEDLWYYARIRVNSRDIERIAEQIGRDIERWQAGQCAQRPESVPTLYVSFDGTAVPIRRKELQGRRGKQPDGSAKGREVKVGCVFTQTCLDQNGLPLRDEHSTTYVAGIESATFFGQRIWQEALNRGLEQAHRVIVLTDGAAYNKSIAQTYFPHATQIIDLYHAREHLHRLAELLLSPKEQAVVLTEWLKRLDEGAIELILKEAQTRLPRCGKRRREAVKHIGYFKKNASFMRYAYFRSQGLFIGSGVVESGCRTIVSQRLKRPGMFWSVRGAHAILQVRCCLLSGRFEEFWEARAAA